MKETTETFYCDRCGKVINSQESGALIGSYQEIKDRIGRALHRGGCVYVYIGSDNDIQLDLCHDCNKSLSEWFNKPKEIGEQCE